MQVRLAGGIVISDKSKRDRVTWYSIAGSKLGMAQSPDQRNTSVSISAGVRAKSKQHHLNILLQMYLKTHLEIPDVHLVIDFAETQKEREVLSLLFAHQIMGRPFVVPADVSEKRVATLRKAMAETTQDPEFFEDASKQGLVINFVSGEEIQDLVT